MPVIAICYPADSVSQISYNPVSMGLGGGGTSYVTDYEALFINPANLQIREKNYGVQFSLGESGAYFDTPLQKQGRPGQNPTVYGYIQDG